MQRRIDSIMARAKHMREMAAAAMRLNPTPANTAEIARWNVRADSLDGKAARMMNARKTHGRTP